MSGTVQVPQAGVRDGFGRGVHVLLWLRVVLVAFIVTVVVPSRLRAIQASEHPEVAVVPTGDTCLDCVQLQPLVALGETDGEGYLIHEADVVLLDARHRIWVFQRTAPRLFDLGGDFIRQVGRNGAGPGEFRDVITGFVGRSGRIHVFDIGNLRQTIFSDDLELIETHRTPGTVVRAAPLVLQPGYVANMSVNTSAAYGLPLHFVSGHPPRIIASLTPTGSSGRVRPIMSFFRIAVADDGTVFTATDDYRVDQWTEAGRLVRTLVVDRPWEVTNNRTGRAQRAGAEATLDGLLMAIHVDAQNWMWVSAWVPKADWRDHIGVRPDGSMYRDDPEAVYDSLVDVIDLGTGELIARSFGPGPLIAGFVNDSIVHSPDYRASGEYKLALLKLSLRSN